MKPKLQIISALTITLLGGLVAALIAAALFVSGALNPWVVIGGTLLFNLIWWWVTPFILDLSMKWLHGIEWVSLDDLGNQQPEVASFIEKICEKYQIKTPRLGLIDDLSPTAFTYGATANNARLVVSTGLFHYLDEEEAVAVYAHELGHIVNRDFIVMSVGSALVQLLYMLYVFFSDNTHNIDTSSSSDDDDNGKFNYFLIAIGIAAYLFYLIGTYALLYLSRTREYLADQFSAEETGNPNALSMALTKIAYGIVSAEEAGGSKRLLESSRALGVFDHKSARSVGVNDVATTSTAQISKVFLFDLFSPWAMISELSSTHPLTGKRIRALSTTARTLGQEPAYDFGDIAALGNQLDMGRMRAKFAAEVGIYYSPWLGALAGAVIALNSPVTGVAGILLGLGVANILKGYYSYSNPDNAEPKTFLELMSDPYASPLRGQPVKLEGKLIGKADAGNIVGEDFMLQDRTGIVYLNYESLFGFIGNFIFAWKKSDALIGKKVKTTGWFRRGVMPQVDMLSMDTGEGEIIRSYTRAWAMIPGAIVIGLGLLCAWMQL